MQHLNDFQGLVILPTNMGGDIKKMNNFQLPPEDQAFIEKLIAETELQPELVLQILFLVTKKYPSLDIRGAKADLQREIADAIERAALNA